MDSYGFHDGNISNIIYNRTIDFRHVNSSSFISIYTVMNLMLDSLFIFLSSFQLNFMLDALILFDD